MFCAGFTDWKFWVKSWHSANASLPQTFSDTVLTQ